MDSNQEPNGYEPFALPLSYIPKIKTYILYHILYVFVKGYDSKIKTFHKKYII